jgi:hypothetical protein
VEGQEQQQSPLVATAAAQISMKTFGRGQFRSFKERLKQIEDTRFKVFKFA